MNMIVLKTRVRIHSTLANKLIFSKWREALGNNIKFIVTGDSPPHFACLGYLLLLNPHLWDGPTENSPVISVTPIPRE
jgi:long-chain acyl-CoA synthetase